ncbi:hypothetical protein [Aquabacter spiritensis]|uniref:Uncharacterized protein n=1 Tax=Aquabacter spiritensis TaxID=933073 RepID=A0A4R3M4B0_9HYPH|nr:hypothetical protein [Aquabacter spiritensis]TCT06197.1 hypothetical protein EDC64_103301 [Aquabacter spiritensis]
MSLSPLPLGGAAPSATRTPSRSAALALVFGAFVLAGCATEPPPPPAPAIPQYTSPIPASALVGRYGLAAYHRPQDATRTETQARAQCSNPYVITDGPNGGVMMYLADDTKLTEVISKQVPGQPTYIGPAEDPAGGERDRQVISFNGTVLQLKWVDPEIAKRYGIMVYVRCP